MKSHLKTIDDVEQEHSPGIRYLSNWFIIMRDPKGHPLNPGHTQINLEDIETIEEPVITITENLNHIDKLTFTPTHKVKVETERMKVCAVDLSRILANDEKLSFDDKIISSSPMLEWDDVTIFRHTKSPAHVRKSRYLWILVDSHAPKKLDPKIKESKPITYLLGCLGNAKNQWAIFVILAALANAVLQKTTDHDKLEPWNHLDRDHLVNFLLYFYIELRLPKDYQKFSSFAIHIKSSLKKITEEALKYLLLSSKNDLIVKESAACKILSVALKSLNRHIEKQVTSLPDEMMLEKIELCPKQKKSWCYFFATKALPIAAVTTAAVAITSRILHK